MFFVSLRFTLLASRWWFATAHEIGVLAYAYPILIPYLSYAYLSVFFRYSFNEVPMKFL